MQCKHTWHAFFINSNTNFTKEKWVKVDLIMVYVYQLLYGLISHWYQHTLGEVLIDLFCVWKYFFMQLDFVGKMVIEGDHFVEIIQTETNSHEFMWWNINRLKCAIVDN